MRASHQIEEDDFLQGISLPAENILTGIDCGPKILNILCSPAIGARVRIRIMRV